ncbi:MAG: suppressor of fused domain protein [Oscillospiraceae bacterium]|nr:suppressor of fused domain protein [Oscillospiraceae bacterium]
MTQDEFRAKAKDTEWAPGWDEIESAFKAVYGDAEPEHFGTVITSRAMFGGNEYLDGYSAYASQKGYSHIVTFGMSELYADEEKLGGEYSKWGYEMTIKLKGEEPKKCIWAMNMMGNLARYTFQSDRWFEPGQYVGSAKNPASIDLGRPDCKITAVLVTNDTEIETRQTIYGELAFLQLVGITQNEFSAVVSDRSLVPTLLERLRADYPDLETDMNRTKDYI